MKLNYLIKIAKYLSILLLMLYVYYYKKISHSGARSANLIRIFQNIAEPAPAVIDSVLVRKDDDAQKQIAGNANTLPPTKNCKDDKQNDWISLGPTTYVKRTSVFYFLDTRELRIFYVQKDVEFEFLSIKISLIRNHKVLFTLPVQNKSLHTTYMVVNYYAKVMQVSVEFPKHPWWLKHMKFTDMLRVELGYSKYRRQVFARLFNWNNAEENFSARNTSLICSKFLFNPQDKQDEVDWKWWFELSRLAGVQRVQMTTLPFENRSQSHDELYARYHDMITLKHMQCVPNLDMWKKRPSNASFFNSYEEFAMHKGPTEDFMYYILVDLLYLIFVNECYLENRQYYKYIFVIEEDQVLLPRFHPRNIAISDNPSVMQSIASLPPLPLDKNTATDKNSGFASITQINRLRTQLFPKIKRPLGTEVNAYDEYFGQILDEEKVVEPQTFMFSYASPLVNDDIAFLCHRFQEMQDRLLEPGFKFEQIVIRPRESQEYNVTFDRRQDVLHAVQLCSVYHNVIEPYMKDTKQLLDASGLASSTFCRFFFVQSSHGKSVHDTRKTSLFELHMPIHVAPSRVNYTHNNYTDYYRHSEIVYAVDFKQGFLSHFRRKYLLYKNPDVSMLAKPNAVPARDIGVDLEYLLSYYDPIVRNYAQNKDDFTV